MLCLYDNAGKGIFQDGMFHKNNGKKLEKLRMDRGVDHKETMKLVAKDRGISKRDVYQYLLK